MCTRVFLFAQEGLRKHVVLAVVDGAQVRAAAALVLLVRGVAELAALGRRIRLADDRAFVVSVGVGVGIGIGIGVGVGIGIGVGVCIGVGIGVGVRVAVCIRVSS